MRILCVFGRHQYGDPTRGDGYEYANFMPALRNLGHEVHLFDSWRRPLHSSFSELNRAFLLDVEQRAPDLILSVQRTYEIWSECWDIVRDSGTAATVNWATDDSWKYSQFSRFVAPHIHACATTYRQAFDRYELSGLARALLTQWAANSANLRHPLKGADCTYSVSFLGSAYGHRRNWIAYLRQKGVNVVCFGHGWPGGVVPSSMVPEIYQKSVISLNFSDGAWTYHNLVGRPIKQVKARTFEVPGAGGFLLTEQGEQLDQFYLPDKEIVTFRTEGELVEKIRYYLDNPAERDRIAEAAHERTRTEHTYEHRFRDLIPFAIKCRDEFRDGSKLRKDHGIDWDKFEEAVAKHKMGLGMKFLKTALTAPCSLVWGPSRGPRAARRLLFELSWRVAGAHTYSSGGWPGRMFYGAS